MPDNPLGYQDAVHDFNEARFKASLQEVLARLTGRSNELLSYEEVAEKLKLTGRSEGGVRVIPLSAIVGSVGRYNEFNRSFLPLKNRDQERWARVKAAADDPKEKLPPIDVYKVGEVYFVLDGNHRVSVAREEGVEYIEAHVIEVKTDVPLTPDVQPDDLIIKAEYAEFLEKTDFNNLRPGEDLSVTVPGQYEKLLEHIQVHHYFMGIDFQRDISYPEAVAHWYDTVYLPIIEPVRELGLLHWFPGRTLTDLYLWVSEHRAALESELGWSIRPEAAITDLAVNESHVGEATGTGSWRMSKMFDRYTDRLFMDILVPLDGSANGWQALEQAILLAQKEQAVLHGLHVVPTAVAMDQGKTDEIKRRFLDRCQQANLPGSLYVDRGDTARKICERVLLTDLMVLNVAHPPLPGFSSLHSGLRSIIWKSSRPILTATGNVSSMDRLLLAFDHKPKSREALFVATYLAEKWKSSLTVLTVTGDASGSVQDYARSYLELHEVQADFLVQKGSRESILKVIKERQVNLVLMGGYSGNMLKEFLFGSAVNLLLRRSPCPILICR